MCLNEANAVLSSADKDTFITNPDLLDLQTLVYLDLRSVITLHSAHQAALFLLLYVPAVCLVIESLVCIIMQTTASQLLFI